MNRRTIFIILAALVLALVVGLVWFWFFTGNNAAPATTGSFGTGASKTTNTTGTTNSQNNLPSNVLPTGTSGAQTGAGGQSYGGQTFSTTSVGGVDAVPGVAWLGGSGFGGGGPTTSFVPKAINQLNDGTVGGSPGIIGSFGGTDVGGSGNNDFGLVGLAGAAAGCALLAAFQGQGEAQAAGESAQAVAGAVLVFDWRLNAKQAVPQYKNFGDCITRTIAKAVLQQITSSIVNWINSGFNGKPSFVTNFNQFFTNAGDQAAGEFIRGTGLAFLCSPFQLQIRIAIAQSYARRNSPSCTLSGVVKNINGFMNGNFAAGGWGGLLQFTTIPTNNPFGAYAYAQIGLQSSISSAQNNARNNLSPGGFISLQKCNPPNSKNPKDCQVSTPGTIIEGTLANTLNIPQQQLADAGVNGSFDAIISALITQLTTRTLYQGLSTLSGQNGYAANYLTPEQQKAQTDAQTLLNNLQGYLQVSQQYGSVQQGSISDIQNAQQQLNALFNCYTNKGQTAEASSTQEIINNYDTSVAVYNANITKANQSIAVLQDLQTRAISVASAADVAAVTASFNSGLGSGAIITPADVTTAQQDRATLQSYVAGRNSATATALQQCNAL